MLTVAEIFDNADGKAFTDADVQARLDAWAEATGIDRSALGYTTNCYTPPEVNGVASGTLETTEYTSTGPGVASEDTESINDPNAIDLNTPISTVDCGYYHDVDLDANLRAKPADQEDGVYNPTGSNHTVCGNTLTISTSALPYKNISYFLELVQEMLAESPTRLETLWQEYDTSSTICAGPRLDTEYDRIILDAPQSPPALPPSPAPPLGKCKLDFMTVNLRGGDLGYAFRSDGTIVAEFQLMEQIHAETGLLDSHDGYTCKVKKDYYLGCLDIAAVTTLSNSVSDAWDNGIRTVNVSTDTNRFGGSTTCPTEEGQQDVVGDGMVNVFDMSVLIFYHFGVAPYDTLSTNPSEVETVWKRHGTADRCNDGSSRSDWSALTAVQYCFPSLDSGRRLSDGTVQTVPEMDDQVEMREWARVPGKGSWHRIRVEGLQLALELFLDSLYALEPVDLSNNVYPPEGCVDCEPVWHDPNAPTIRFARRIEYEPYGSSKATDCATIVAAFTGSDAMRGNVLGLRQQPIASACEFDIFVWKPLNAAPSPVSHVCNNTLGLTRGSSAMDGKLGLVQQRRLCSLTLEEYNTAPPTPPLAAAEEANVVSIILGTITITMGIVVLLAVCALCCCLNNPLANSGVYNFLTPPGGGGGGGGGNKKQEQQSGNKGDPLLDGIEGSVSAFDALKLKVDMHRGKNKAVRLQ